jgi:putative membrane protein
MGDNEMEADVTTPHTRSADDLAKDRTAMATTRTLMAADRTLMAWIRTSLSMISFGFTIYRVLEGFQEGGQQLRLEQTPRNIGLILTALGTMAMVMGVTEYWVNVRMLRRYQPVPFARPSMIMALIMAVGGVFMFFSIITGLF